MFTIKFERLQQAVKLGDGMTDKHYLTSVFSAPRYSVVKSSTHYQIQFEGPESYESINVSLAEHDFDHCWIENEAGKTISHYSTCGLTPFSDEPEINETVA